MSILKQELIPQSKQMQEAQAIVNQTEKDKDKLSIFAIRNEIKSILESAYQEVSINPRRFSS